LARFELNYVKRPPSTGLPYIFALISFAFYAEARPPRPAE
jgi:hypothetical protein